MRARASIFQVIHACRTPARRCWALVGKRSVREVAFLLNGDAFCIPVQVRGVVQLDAKARGNLCVSAALATLAAITARLLCAGMIDRWVHRLVQLILA